MVDLQSHSQSVVSGVIFREIRKWLADRFCPQGIVFSSGAVRDTLLKSSSLGPAELLRPFAEIGNYDNVAIQTCEKNQPFKIQNFKMNFVDSHKLDRQGQAYDHSMLVDFIIQNSTPKKFQDITTSSSSNQQDSDKQLKLKLLSLLDYHKYGQLTPWYTKWKRQFLQQTMYSDHELLNQPVAFIYFISATEHDPLGTIDILKRADNLPGLYKEGIYDDSNQSVQQFIMILNPTDNPKVYIDAMETVKQKYPISNIFEVPMTRGSHVVEGQPPLEDLWSKLTDLDEQGLMQELHMESLVRGRSFSNEDRDKINSGISKMIKKLVLPFIQKRIMNLEISVANTRKGFKNQFKNLWKKTERGENDGLKENFKMNKEELELRNLVDLAFVFQDYETAMNNGKLPFSDFKKCKAFRHAASCQEVLAFASLGFDQSFTQPSNFKELDNMLENAYQLYHRTGKTQYLIRSAIYISEVYDCLERHQESANFLLRIANEIKDNSVIVPLFQEQAAYKYLQMRNFRKFALYMILAGKSYEKLNLQNYSFNCFTLVHPFYQRYGKGWNGIRFQLYSSLGRNSQNMGDISLAVQFFRNLLQLCCEFDHQNEQKNCLNEFLIAVQNWSSQKSINLIGADESQPGQEDQAKKAHIGQLNLPIIIEDSIEVFLSSEKLFTNKPESLINQLYFAYPTNSANTIMDDNQEYVIQQKAELNSANCPWKFMAKHLFELMNDERRKNPDLQVPQEACQFNQEELNEFTIYDCTSRVRKRELTANKVRKAYVGESIVVKLLMRNPLMADIFINNIKLKCRYENSDSPSQDNFEQLERNIVLRSLETKEIILEIFPKKAGKFIIERIEWILFDVVSCAYQMVKPTDKDRKLLTQEELVVPKKLLEREMSFIYDVLERSGEISTKILIPENTSDSPNTFIFTEMQKAELYISNDSYKYELKNGYAVCSHPMIFGFSRMRLFDKIERGGKFVLPLFMRASLMHNNEIKFLIRYEVDYDSSSEDKVVNTEGSAQSEKSKMSKFRFCRMIFNLESMFAFTPKRHVHLSTKKANEHIFNIQIVDNAAIGSTFYQTPQIEAIEIINKRGLWTLLKKDDKGQFFIIIPTHNGEHQLQPQSMLVYRDAKNQSIFEDQNKKNYFEQELNFVMSKFKMHPTNEEEEVDIVIQWSMPKLNKRGFYCLFKIPLLKIQKQITEQQKKLQRQRNAQQLNGQGKEGSGPAQNVMRELPKINPLHIAYSYQKSLNHDFSSNTPAIVQFSLSLSNMIQSTDYQVDCKVEGLNEWSTLNSPTDVSEANSFLWVGKTVHIIKHLKANEIKQVTLKCAILRPGVYNLNRFRVALMDSNNNDDEGQTRSNFMNEIRLPDDILITVNDTSRPAPHNLEDQNLIQFD